MPLDLTLEKRRVLGRIAPEEFIGRERELQQFARLAETGSSTRGLFLFAAPNAGASELLRQTYDRLFHQRLNITPIYFAFSSEDVSSAAAAKRFLQTFLSQWTAFRRYDALLVDAPLSVSEWVEMSAPADAAWIEQLVADCKQNENGDKDALIHSCLSVLEGAAAHGARFLVLLDDAHLIEDLENGALLYKAIAQTLMRSDTPFVLSGLRRKLFDLIDAARFAMDRTATLHLQHLDEPDARRLIDEQTRRNDISINDHTRDLIAQQFACNPFYIQTLLRAAREQSISLTSFLNCQKLYVDELMGGRFHRYFAGMLALAAPHAPSRRALLRTLYESAESHTGSKSSIDTWRKRIGLEAETLQDLLDKLHAREIINVVADYVEAIRDSNVWMDYLHSRYRLEIAAEPRALVVAETLRRSLKRAPETMARFYRQETTIDLKELLANFDCQRVPASLLRYEKFAQLYRGAQAEEINKGLSSETDLVRLPQVVHVAQCTAFHVPASLNLSAVQCVVAHGFDAGAYTDASEIVWMAAQLESKNEAGRALTQLTCDRLTAFARACGINQVRFWLIAAEGFSAEACALLDEREAYGSSLRQLELLQATLKGTTTAAGRQITSDEFEMVIPMGEDAELIAARTLEQVARRIDFPPEAINQIKTALVEACINAVEHSHSPDKKIYQQFRVESDRLVVTVSSRGIVVAPPSTAEPSASQPQNNGHGEGQVAERRGWGLKLIRTLMDEAEFERVDDGTRLRMTKYLRR